MDSKIRTEARSNRGKHQKQSKLNVNISLDEAVQWTLVELKGTFASSKTPPCGADSRGI